MKRLRQAAVLAGELGQHGRQRKLLLELVPVKSRCPTRAQRHPTRCYRRQPTQPAVAAAAASVSVCAAADAAVSICYCRVCMCVPCSHFKGATGRLIGRGGGGGSG